MLKRPSKIIEGFIEFFDRCLAVRSGLLEENSKDLALAKFSPCPTGQEVLS